MDEIIERRLRKIEKKHKVERRDAILLDCMDELSREFTDFMVNTLKIEINPETEDYKSDMKIRDFYQEMGKIMTGIINIVTALRNSHSQITDNYMSKIEDFKKELEMIRRTGKKEQIYKLNMDIHTFRIELSDLIKSGHPENLLPTYSASKEERTQRIWTAAKKRLSKFNDANILLQWLVKQGKGIPLTVDEIVNGISQTKNWVRENLQKIQDNSPELLVIGIGVGNHYTYYVPKDFHPYQLS